MIVYCKVTSSLWCNGKVSNSKYEHTKKTYRFCFKRKKYDMNYVFGIKINWYISQTSIKRSPLGHRKMAL